MYNTPQSGTTSSQGNGLPLGKSITLEIRDTWKRNYLSQKHFLMDMDIATGLM